MTTHERQALRAKIDELTRIKVDIENEHLKLCSGCGMPRSDFTPGCSPCWDRHRGWRLGRNRCPYPPDPLLQMHAHAVSRDLQVERGRILGSTYNYASRMAA